MIRKYQSHGDVCINLCRKPGVRAKPDLSWKERIKGFCLYQHQEETETLLPAETFSIHSPTLRPFLSSSPVLLCPLQRGRPTKTPQSVSCSSCARIFSFTAPGSYYTTPHFAFFYSSLSFRVKAHATASDHSWLCLATHIALPEQSLCYCKALSHDSLRKSQPPLWGEGSLHSSVRPRYKQKDAHAFLMVAQLWSYNQRHRKSVSPTILDSHKFSAICLACLIALSVSNTPIHLAIANES